MRVLQLLLLPDGVELCEERIYLQVFEAFGDLLCE